MRLYERIWLKIAETADPVLWVTVSANSLDQVETIVNMVQLEKCRANNARKALELPLWGRLAIKREPAKLLVHFKLRNAGAQL